jgi:tryptophanyl-tRNA synthetase
MTSSQKTPGPQTVLTGVKPTGYIHLGNYVGAIRPVLELAAAPGTESWIFIADYHALTSTPDPKKMREMSYDLAATYLACGLDPAKSVFYRQSDIPEVMELNWVLACFTPKGLMNRAHAYKAKVQENQEQGKDDLDFGVNMGLYTYPILMSADILMFSANKVPVGDDQIQHIEIARDIAQKFNRTYGELLKLPNFVVQAKGKSIPGLDGRKMSKSYDNSIPLFEDPAKMRKLVMKIKSDSLPPEAPKSTEGSIIFELYECFATPAQIEEMRAKYAKGISWGAAKEELFGVIDESLKGPREKYKELMNDKSYMEDLLKKGAARAREKAVPFMKQIRKAMGVDA